MKSKYSSIGLVFCFSIFIAASGQAEEPRLDAPPLLPDINTEASPLLLPELQEADILPLPPELKPKDSEYPPDLADTLQATDAQDAPVLLPLEQQEGTPKQAEQKQIPVVTDPAAMPRYDISLFNHKFHVEGGGFSCTDCHNSIFQQHAGAAAATGDFTMAAFSQGKYCGTCHDGATAFAVTEQGSCIKCHGSYMKIPSSTISN
jgi:c(7)-type cytochrome triheme protein